MATKKEIQKKVENESFPEVILVKVTCMDGRVITGVEERPIEAQADRNDRHETVAEKLGLETSQRSGIVDTGFHVINNGKNVSLATFLTNVKSWNLFPTAIYWQKGKGNAKVYCLEFSDEGDQIGVPKGIKALLKAVSAFAHVWMNVTGVIEWDVLGTDEELASEVPMEDRTKVGTANLYTRMDTVNLIVPRNFVPSGTVNDLILDDTAAKYSLKRI